MINESDCKVGDKVKLQITGVVASFVAECISTKDEPGDSPPYDNPRFKVLGEWDERTQQMTDAGCCQHDVLKPMDYILRRKF